MEVGWRRSYSLFPDIQKAFAHVADLQGDQHHVLATSTNSEALLCARRGQGVAGIGTGPVHQHDVTGIGDEAMC